MPRRNGPYQALSKGVPVLGVPTFHDQDFNMQRVDDLGLGATLYPKGLTGKALRETADRLIADQRVKGNAEAFAEKIARTDAARTAVGVIGSLVVSRKVGR